MDEKWNSLICKLETDYLRGGKNEKKKKRKKTSLELLSLLADSKKKTLTLVVPQDMIIFFELNLFSTFVFLSTMSPTIALLYIVKNLSLEVILLLYFDHL